MKDSKYKTAALNFDSPISRNWGKIGTAKKAGSK